MSLKLLRRPGRPHWYIHGTVRGVSVRESTRVTDRQTAEAIRARREWELTQRSVFGAEATAVFVEAAVSYLEAGGEGRFLSLIIAKIGSTPLAKIDQAFIDKVARELYPDAGPATLNRQAYTPILAVMNHAAKRKMCGRPSVERRKQPKGRVRWLTFDEAERLIDACSPHLRPLVTFLFGTGARASEALYLDWRDVDLARAHVTFVKTKNGEQRGVPLHGRVVEALRVLPHRHGAVFRTHKGRPYARRPHEGGQAMSAFKTACRRAGIEDFHPHDCRHTWATWHYTTNRDLIALMQLGGWKSEHMVLRYAHVNVSHLKTSLDASLAAWSTKSAPSAAPAGQTLKRVK